MRQLAQILSWLSLAALLVPAGLYLTDRIDLATVKTWMLVCTIVWFVTVPCWMGRQPER